MGSGEVPGQEFLDAVDGVLGDLFEHASEIELRIKPVELGCSQQRVDGGGAVTAGIGTTFSFHRTPYPSSAMPTLRPTRAKFS